MLILFLIFPIYFWLGEGADNWEKANLNYEKGDGGEYNKHDESFGFDVTHDESISRANDLSAHGVFPINMIKFKLW